MEINETRRKLIDIIANHQAAQPSKKLSINELSLRAGISRQAFNRYYGDLKDYASGLKPIGDLLTDTDSVRTKELINQNQANLKELQQKMSQLDSEHKKEMEKTLDTYVTSLMVNDVTMHGANDIRVTLEKQTLHNVDLKKQLGQLEIELARAKQSAALVPTENTIHSAAKGEKIKVDIDLSKALALYATAKSDDDFEDKKELAIAIALKQINKLASDKACNIALFAERYIARFSVFFENYQCRNDSMHIVVRVPIFNRSELKAFITKLPPARFLSVHIPHSESQSETNAQRGFYFGSIPKLELDGADNADPISMNLGFNEIIHYKIRQGE